MKIIISQRVDIVGDNFPHNWRKEYESIIIPRTGDFIEDSIWKEPYEYKVIGVTINYCDNECYIEVEKYNVDITSERKDEFTRIANFHGWKTSWNLYK